MSFDLAQIQNTLPTTTIDKDAFPTNAWLPRLQLMTSATGKVKKGEWDAINSFAMVSGQDFTDLGKTPNVFVCSVRPKAIIFENNTVTAQSYDTKSDTYKAIVDKVGVPDSGAQVGPEFLFWLLDLKTFATFHLGSVTACKEFDLFNANMHKVITLKHKIINSKKRGPYASPTCAATDIVLGPDCGLDTAELIAQCTKFVNPPEDDKQLITDTGAEAERAR